MKGSYIVSEEEYRKAIKERDDARNAYNDTKAENERLNTDLTLARNELDDLKKKPSKDEVAKARDEARKAREDGAELQRKLTAAETEAEKAKEEARKAKEDGAELQRKLTAAETEAEKAKEEARKAQEDAAELQRKLTAAETEAKKAKSDGSARLRRLLQNNPERTAAARPYIEAIRNNRKDLLGLLVQWEDQDSEEENFLDGIF